MYKNDTKIILRESMRGLLSKRSLDKISVGDIVKDCKISRATFYRNFKDKYDLMNFCFKGMVDELEKNMTLETWTKFLASIFRFVKTDQKFYVNAFKSEGDNSFLAYLYKVNIEFYERQLLGCTKATSLQEVDKACVAFFCAGEIQIFKDWLLRGAKESPEELTQWCYDFMPKRFQEIFKQKE